MTTFQHTYTPEGSDAPVTIDVPYPTGAITPEDASKFMPNDAFQSELQRRTTSILSNKRDDADYKVDLLAHWGIDPDAKPGDADETIEARLTAERQTWETSTLKPLEDRLATSDKRITRLLGTRLQAEILAASGSVKEPFRTSPRAGIKPAIVATVGDLFGYDEEADSFFVRNGDDGYTFTKSPAEGQSPYMGVSEFMGEFLGRESNKALLDDVRQRGPNATGGDGGKTGEAAFTLTREEATDVTKYRAASKLAKEAGHATPIIAQ